MRLFLCGWLVVGEPGGDLRVRVAEAAVQHDVGDGDDESGDRGELASLGAAGRRAAWCERRLPVAVAGP
jgi:hypothetical protein